MRGGVFIGFSAVFLSSVCVSVCTETVCSMISEWDDSSKASACVGTDVSVVIVSDGIESGATGVRVTWSQSQEKSVIRPAAAQYCIASLISAVPMPSVFEISAISTSVPAWRNSHSSTFK